MALTGAGKLLLASGRTLATDEEGVVSELDTLDGDPLCATTDGDGRTIVMSTEGAVRIDACATQTERVDAPYRNIVLRAVDCSPLVVSTGPTLLTGDYSGSADVTQADRRRITASLLKSYGELAAMASDSGVMLQPTVGRYRLLDASGRILFTSPPILLGASTGRQCTDVLTLQSDTRAAMPAYTLQATPWRPQLVIPAGARMPEVATAEVIVSPQLHPVDPSGEAMAFAVRRAGSQDFLRVRMPGYRSAGAYAADVVAACGRMEQIGRVVATMAQPFGSVMARTVNLDIATDADYAKDCRELRRALGRSRKSVPYMTARLGAPNTFTAATVAASADVTLWGGLKVKRFEGYSPMLFAAQTGSDAWTATVAVTFADGSRQVTAFSDTTANPVRFGPLIGYPAPDAVQMEISLRRSGMGIAKQTFALRPDGSGVRSVWVAPDLRPFELTGTAQTMPQPQTAPVLDLGATVAAAPTDDPMRVMATADIGPGRITAMVHAPLSQNSWDFGRSRFYAFSTAGTCAVTIGTAMTSISLNHLDDRPVRRADAVCRADSKVYAVGGDDILCIEASRVATLRAKTDAVALAFAQNFGELWALRADGSVRVYLPGRRMSCYDRPDAGLTTLHSIGGRALAGSSRGVCDLNSETYGPVDVMWEAMLRPGDMTRRRLGEVFVDAGAMNITGSVALTRVALTSGAPVADLTFTFRGQLLSALRLPVSSIYPVRYVRLRVEATTSPDFILSEISLTTDR